MTLIFFVILVYNLEIKKISSFFLPASMPTLHRFGLPISLVHFSPEDLTTELRKNKFFTVAPDKQEKSPIPDELIDACEPVKSILRSLMEKFCPSKLPWKQLELVLPKGKFCTLEQSFGYFDGG